MATFYLDAPTLAEATAVFSDTTLDTKAADGFYSDGSIYREQSSGVLLPSTTCPLCTVNCNTVINASGLAQGYYEINYLMTAATGAIALTFDPGDAPKGIAAEFDGVNYTKVVSAGGGAVEGANFSVIGKSSEDCGIQGSVFSLDKYIYGASAFNQTEDSVTMNATASDINLTAAAPGSSYIIIPKEAATPTALKVKVYVPCNTDLAFDIDVDCAATLTSFSASPAQDNSVGICDAGFSETLYNFPINGTAGSPDVGDLIFQDANGATPAAAGWYKVDLATDIAILVDSLGVVSQKVDCGNEIYVSASLEGGATVSVTLDITGE